MTIAAATRPLPPLGPPRPELPLDVAEETLSNGLRVMVVHQPSVPLAQVRVHIPFAGRADEIAATSLMSETLLAGTSTRDNVELAADLQSLGGSLGVSINADHLSLSGGVLATGIEKFLGLIADILIDAQYPERQVAVEAKHLSDNIELALARSSTVARKTLLRRLYGDHPCGVELPEPADVLAMRNEHLRELHAARVLPRGSTLIIVGDVDATSVVSAAQRTLGGWDAAGVATPHKPPTPWKAGSTLLVNRQGSVQSSIRYALPAVTRLHPEYAAYRLANFIFGGYFSSRLVRNIREDKGYAYRATSSLHHTASTSVLFVDADVATDVTSNTLVEVDYELGRIATGGVREEEVEDVRRYAAGTRALSLATQGGLASTLETLVEVALPASWLSDHARALEEVSVADVAAAAAKYFNPMAAVRVVVGNADEMRTALARVTPLG